MTAPLLCPHCGLPLALSPAAPPASLAETLAILIQRQPNIRGRFLALLADRFDTMVPATFIMNAIWGRPGGPLRAPTSLHVYAYELRKLLKPLDLTVTGVRNYRHTNESAFRLQRLAG